MVEVADLGVGVDAGLALWEHRRQHVLLGRRGVLHAAAEVLLLEESETRALLLFVARVLVVLVLPFEAVVAHGLFKRFDGWFDLSGLVVFAALLVTRVDLRRVLVGCNSLLTT